MIFLVAPFGLSSNGLSLRVQSNTSEFAKEYLNTSKCNDANLVALLKRLYNIVDLPLNEIDDIVDDFIF